MMTTNRQVRGFMKDGRLNPSRKLMEFMMFQELTEVCAGVFLSIACRDEPKSRCPYTLFSKTDYER